jgi:hypothetical protein
MVTMPEEYTTEEQRSVVRFLWAEGLNAKNISEEMFPLYGGKCLSCKVDPFSFTIKENVISTVAKFCV